mmetsp:Transcript_41700/g.138683  ORF Transcript_41700/g.138683 Transcript_41700/m.138683 type:complete len:287 (-) Transcript_41700:303-1163(-)
MSTARPGTCPRHVHRREPWRCRHARRGRAGGHERRDGTEPRAHVRHQPSAALRSTERGCDGHHVAEHVVERDRHDADECRGGQSHTSRVDVLRSDGADAALLLRDDDVRPEAAHKRGANLVDWAASRRLRAHRLVQLQRRRVWVDARRGHHRQRRRERRVVAAMRAADQQVRAAEAADDLGGGGEEREDAQIGGSGRWRAGAALRRAEVEPHLKLGAPVAALLVEGRVLVRAVEDHLVAACFARELSEPSQQRAADPAPARLFVRDDVLDVAHASAAADKLVLHDE